MACQSFKIHCLRLSIRYLLLEKRSQRSRPTHKKADTSVTAIYRPKLHAVRRVETLSAPDAKT
jgi:hypothetical protein